MTLATRLTEAELQDRAQMYTAQAAQLQAATLLCELTRRLPQHVDDNDLAGAQLALRQGLEGLQQLCGTVPPDSYVLPDVIADLQRTTQGLITGWQSLDRLIHIPAGAITLLAGRPGHGKTIMLLAGKVLHHEFNQEAYLGYLKEMHGPEAAIERPEGAVRGVYPERAPLAAGSVAGRRGSGQEHRLALRPGWRVAGRLHPEGAAHSASQRYLEVKEASTLLEQAVQTNIRIIVGTQFGRAQGTIQKVRLDNLREAGVLEQDAALVVDIYNASVERVSGCWQGGSRAGRRSGVVDPQAARRGRGSQSDARIRAPHASTEGSGHE